MSNNPSQPRFFPPSAVPRKAAEQLELAGFIYYCRESYHAYLFGVPMTFSPAQRACFDVLWDNLFRGNLPIANERIIRDCGGSTSHIFHHFKRHVAWREKMIVGDGRGNFWIRIPPDALLALDGLETPSLPWKPLGSLAGIR